MEACFKDFSVVYDIALVRVTVPVVFVAEIGDLVCSLVFVPAGGPVITFLSSKATQREDNKNVKERDLSLPLIS